MKVLSYSPSASRCVSLRPKWRQLHPPCSIRAHDRREYQPYYSLLHGRCSSSQWPAMFLRFHRGSCLLAYKAYVFIDRGSDSPVSQPC